MSTTTLDAAFANFITSVNIEQQIIFGFSIYSATAKFKTGNAQRDSLYTVKAVDTKSPQKALQKALQKAHKYYRLVTPRYDFVGSMRDLDFLKTLSPKKIIPISPEQSSRSNVTVFDASNSRIAWKFSEKYSTKDKLLIPIDLIYCGNFSNIPSKIERIYRSNSSGSASHKVRETAIKTATLELIERDAIMQFWYHQKGAIRIHEEDFPKSVKKISSILEEHKETLRIFSLDSKHGITILATISGKKFPAFACGASTTFDNINQAIEGAVEEALINILELQNSQNVKLKPWDVVSTWQHGLYYASPKNAKKMAWLNEVPYGPKPTLLGCDFLKVATDLELFVSDLTQHGDQIHTIRVFSPKLVPATFGYGMELYDHPNFAEAAHGKCMEPLFYTLGKEAI